MQDLSFEQRVAGALYLIWFFLHLVLFFYADQGPDNALFWPFYTSDKPLSATYSVSEFLVYITVPLVLFIAYQMAFGKTAGASATSRRHSSFFLSFLTEKIRAEELQQQLNELQNLPISFERLNELKADKEKAANTNINFWLDKIEIRKKYKEFEN